MRLSALLDGLGCAPPRLPPRHAGVADPEVRGICHDSRRVVPGDLFVAIIGEQHDGRRFASAAVEAGAVAVLGPPATDLDLGVPHVEAAAPRALLGPLAARLYEHPDRAMTMVGVTGTNGKSTVVALVAAMLDAAGRPAGRLGTLGYSFRAARFPELDALGRTTPEASDLFRVLRVMRDAGAKAAVMEVSSHALDQGRVAGARFDVGVFTNLSRDHLDYHGDLEHYFGAKRRLFDQLAAGGRSVLNVDDAYGRRLAASQQRAVTFAVADAGAADVFVRAAQLDFHGIRASLVTPRGALDIETGLIGRFNLINLVTAVAVAEALDIDHRFVKQALSALQPVTGRLEAVATDQPFPALIDFAHTPGALDAALSSLRELSAPRGLRIAIVFGCGGDRDKGKRVPMGQAVASGADFAIATSDNPRGEDPAAILAAVEEGLRMPGGCPYRIVPERAAAIHAAVRHAAAEPGRWALLIAGKGHERAQRIGDRVLAFSDHDELRRALDAVSSPRRGFAGEEEAVNG